MKDLPVHLAVAPVREVRRDLRRSVPWLAGLLLCALIYVLLSAAAIRFWESQWTFMRACYFTTINMTTVGFGDVVPSSRPGKLIAGANAFAGLILFGTLVAVVALALQPTSWTGTIGVGERPAEEPQVAQDEHLKRGAAQLLEGLGVLVASSQKEMPAERVRGLVRIHVHGAGRPHADIEVFVDLDAG